MFRFLFLFNFSSKYFILILFFVSSISNANISGNPTENFNPVYSGKGFITVHSSDTVSKYHLNVGLFVDYAKETLPVYPTVVDPNLGDSLIFSHLVFGFGLTEKWDLGLSIPNLLGQSVSSSQLRGQYAKTGLLEFRLASKYRLKDFEEGGGVAVLGSLGFNQTDSLPLVGEDPGPSFNLQLMMDKAYGRWLWAGNLGYRMVSPGEQFSGFNRFQPLGSGLFMSAGGRYQMSDSWYGLAELWASMPDADLGDVDREENSYEFLLAARYQTELQNSNALNFNFGLTREINHGLSTPSIRLFAGVNYTFGPLFGKPEVDTNTSGPVVIKKNVYEEQDEIPIEDEAEESNYNEGYRQGYMAGYGMGPNAGLGPQQGDNLDGGLDFPEGYNEGYLDSIGKYPGGSNRPIWAKCYRTGFQGKVGNGPAKGKDASFGSKLKAGEDCPDGFETGWNDAPQAGEDEQDDEATDSNYNPGYREGYQAGYGIGPNAGLGPDQGQTMDGGFEYPEGYYDGYIDASGPFPGDPERRPYAKGYRNGFQGKLGVGPGAGKDKNYGSILDSTPDFPEGFEHGWLDAPDSNEEITAPKNEDIPEDEDANVDYDSDIKTIVIDTDEDVLANRRPEEEEKLQIQNITFNTNSAVITKSSDKVLQNVVKYLKKHDFKTLEIWGHTDGRGAALYNEKLSLARAESVYNYLIEKGLDSNKMRFDGWGERKPVAPNSTPEELRQNRRVEFVIRR